MIDSLPATITLPSETEILISCAFDAPPEVVWEAWTTPELVKRWWPGNRGEMTVVDIDLRVGGQWRYVMLTHGGVEVAFHGTYREVVPGARLVSTDVFEMLGAPALPPELEPVGTTTFAVGPGGGTALTMLMQVADRGMRDMILGSGMEGGVQEQMAALGGVARSLVA